MGPTRSSGSTFLTCRSCITSCRRSTKAPGTLVESGATVAYPPETTNYHFEMELVLATGKPGFRVAQADAAALIYGYACGLNMTRRDLQLLARDKGPPWHLGKDIEHGTVVSEIATEASRHGQAARGGQKRRRYVTATPPTPPAARPRPCYRPAGPSHPVALPAPAPERLPARPAGC